MFFIIKGFNLVLGFPNTKYPPNTKNYLPCLVIGGVFNIRRKGLLKIVIYSWFTHDKLWLSIAMWVYQRAIMLI